METIGLYCKHSGCASMRFQIVITARAIVAQCIECGPGSEFPICDRPDAGSGSTAAFYFRELTAHAVKVAECESCGSYADQSMMRTIGDVRRCDECQDRPCDCDAARAHGAHVIGIHESDDR